MHCLPAVNVSRPDAVVLSGSTTLRAMKAFYNWTLSGFDICPDDTENILSPIFSHPNLSKWCVELEKEDGSPIMCFRLVSSDSSLPVSATLIASVLDRDGERRLVYVYDVDSLQVNDKSPAQCVLDHIDKKQLGDEWRFKCEVSTLEVVTEDTSDTSNEVAQSAVAKDLEQLLDLKDLADIVLITGGVRLEAHKVILCARSPVFRAMLSHDTKEAREGLVEIPDVEPEVVSEMLHYMYTDQVRTPSDMMVQLLVASDKYGLQDAKIKYELELANQLTVENAASIAVYAIFHSCSFLQNVCLGFIKKNLQQVVGSISWANIIDKYPRIVKTISEIVAEDSERSSLLPAVPGSQSDATSEVFQAVEPVSELFTPVVPGGSLDTVWDSGYTSCERRSVVYVWTITGLTNWPRGRNFVPSPHFFHPETIQWELRLYKCGTEFDVRFRLLENKSGSLATVDLSVSVIPPQGEICRIDTWKGRDLTEGGQSGKFECGYLVDDVLTVECEICMVCAVQQSVVAFKPTLQSNLRQDLCALLEAGNFADFKLRTGTVEMGVHRAILVARSPLFARLLQPGSEVSNKGLLEVPNVKPEVLTNILHYMYTGSVKYLGDSTGELLAAARKFELGDLERDCFAHISRQLNVSNAVGAAVCAMENKCNTLLDLCVKFIRSHFKQVMGTTEWMDAIDRNPAALKRLSQLVAEP